MSGKAQNAPVVAQAVGGGEFASAAALIRCSGGIAPRSGPGAASDDRFLKRPAEETGGRLLYAERNRDLQRSFARVFEEFNRRYVLGYAPANVPPGGWHRLEVRLKTRKGTVPARRGYFAD